MTSNLTLSALKTNSSAGSCPKYNKRKMWRHRITLRRAISITSTEWSSISIYPLIVTFCFSVSDTKINMRLDKNATMYGGHIPDTVQFSATSQRSFQAWSSAVFGDLHLLADDSGTAHCVAAACNGTVKSTGSCWSLESCPYSKRYVQPSKDWRFKLWRFLILIFEFHAW